MAKEPEAVSPEEKLLKVIQKGEAQRKTARTAATAAAAEAERDTATATATAAPPARKPQVRLAKPAAADQKPTAPRQDAPPAAKAGPAPAAPVFRKPGQVQGNGKGLRAAKLALAAIAAVMLVLTVREIQAGIARTRQDREAKEGQGPAETPSLAAEPQAPDLAPLLSAVSSRPLFGGGSENLKPNGDDGKPPPGSWQAYVRENMAMIGVSRVPDSEDKNEAILFDRKENKLHFVRVGQKLTVAQQDLKVEQVGGEDTVLTDGFDQVSVRGGARSR